MFAKHYTHSFEGKRREAQVTSNGRQSRTSGAPPLQTRSSSVTRLCSRLAFDRKQMQELFHTDFSCGAAIDWFRRPNPNLSSTGTSRFLLLAWNTRRLMHHKPVVRAREIAFFLRISSKRSKSVITEAHGTDTTVNTKLHRVSQKFSMFFSG